MSEHAAICGPSYRTPPHARIMRSQHEGPRQLTHASFIEAVARLSRGIDAQLHRDALDWLREPWGTEARAVEVLTEGIRVLIADRAEGIGGLVALCVEAVAAGVIVDERHAEFFAGCHPARN